MEAAIKAFASSAKVLVRGAGAAESIETALRGVCAQARSASGIFYLGETHEQADVLRFQIAVAQAVISSKPAAVHVVFEHFTTHEQASLQRILDVRSTGPLQGQTSEGFTGILALVQYLRDHAHDVPVRLYAGFPTRDQARRFVRPAEQEVAWREGEQAGWLPKRRRELLEGTEGHYAFFEALLTGAEEEDGAEWAPTGSSRRIFPAQTVKDCSQAYAVARAWSDLPASAEDSTSSEEEGHSPSRPLSSRHGIVLSLTGTGHCDYGFGVPERVASLLGIPAHVPSPLEGRGRGQQGQPVQCILTVRPRAAVSTIMPRISFPSPTGGREVRVMADVLYCYEHTEPEEEDEGDGEGTSAHT